jgi:hypothetical protein
VDPASFITHGSDIAYLGENIRVDRGVPLNCKACATQHRQAWMQLFPKVQCDNKDTQDSNAFDDEHDHFMLLPSRVLGFLLGRKQWAQLLVENIQPLEQDDMKDDIGSQIALPQYLELSKLQNMVSCHSSVVNAPDRSSMRDPIDGKGNGLVLLFHGK